MNQFMNRRRLFAALFLIVAALMLIVGETLLKQRLSPYSMLIYWAGCFLATIAAVLCAFLDLGHSFRDSHSEQRKLLQETVLKIKSERDCRPPPDSDTRKSR
jgi:drug/metabolite transporter (DMT)-like permease